MKYKGVELKGYTEIIEYALKLKGAEQREFVEAYAKTGPYALQNVGYFSGYYDAKESAKIMRVFKTAHPIFGTARPDAKTAIKVGITPGKMAARRAEGGK